MAKVVYDTKFKGAMCWRPVEYAGLQGLFVDNCDYEPNYKFKFIELDDFGDPWGMYSTDEVFNGSTEWENYDGMQICCHLCLAYAFAALNYWLTVWWRWGL